MTNILLTGIGGSASANVHDALKLAQSSYCIHGADASVFMLALAPTQHKHLIPRAQDPRYLTAISELIENLSIDVVLAQPDPEVLMISANREKINASLFLPEHESLEIASNKAESVRVWQSSNVPVPNALRIESIDDVGSACQALLERAEKLWVRAVSGAGSRAALPVSAPQQAISWVEWWVSERGLRPSDFMVSEFLPGREFAVQTVWQNGKLIVAQARERVAYLYGFLSPSGQSSTPAIARTVSDSVVYDTAIRAIRAISRSPNGVFCVDLKSDQNEIPKVTEVNAGRFFTTSNFFAHAGINMPEMAVRAARGEVLSLIGVNPLPENLYWIRMVDMGFKLVTEDELFSLRKNDF